MFAKKLKFNKESTVRILSCETSENTELNKNTEKFYNIQ